ncbi:hypothetical protein BDZ91DRAFT_77440 [Kalaharituber pfeilii]|nr:hypothetical protein BDZ91DRAFT_77440 [Kalaharituber pfeilii]
MSSVEEHCAPKPANMACIRITYSTCALDTFSKLAFVESLGRTRRCIDLLGGRLDKRSFFVKLSNGLMPDNTLGGDSTLAMSNHCSGQGQRSNRKWNESGVESYSQSRSEQSCIQKDISLQVLSLMLGEFDAIGNCPRPHGELKDTCRSH